MGFSILCLSQFQALQNVNQEMIKRFEMLCNSRQYFNILQQKHNLKHQIFQHNVQVLSIHIGDVHFLLYPTKQVHSLELDELCDSLSPLMASVNTCKIL